MSRDVTVLAVAKGEWMKLRKHRGFLWWGVSAILACTAFACASAYLGVQDRASAESAHMMASVVSSGAYPGALLLALGMCSWLAEEFESGSNLLTLLVVPQRRVVAAARLIACTAVAVASAILWLAIGAVAAVGFFGTSSLSSVVGVRDLWVGALAAVAVCVSLCILAVFAATMARRPLSSAGVIVAIVVLVPALEAYLTLSSRLTWLASVLRWSPGALMGRALTLPPLDGRLGTSVVASGSLLAWAAVLAVIAGWSFAARD